MSVKTRLSIRKESSNTEEPFRLHLEYENNSNDIINGDRVICGESIQDVFAETINMSRNTVKDSMDMLSNIMNANISIEDTDYNGNDIFNITKASISEMKNPKYTNKYHSIIKQLDEISDPELIKVAKDFISEIINVVSKCYEEDIILPSITTIRSIGTIQIRWDDSNVSLIVTGNDDRRESYIRFKGIEDIIKVHVKDLSMLIPLLKKFLMYQWLK